MLDFNSAENGCFIKPRPVAGRLQPWINAVVNYNLSWKAPCLEILQYVRPPSNYLKAFLSAQITNYLFFFKKKILSSPNVHQVRSSRNVKPPSCGVSGSTTILALQTDNGHDDKLLKHRITSSIPLARNTVYGSSQVQTPSSYCQTTSPDPVPSDRYSHQAVHSPHRTSPVLVRCGSRTYRVKIRIF